MVGSAVVGVAIGVEVVETVVDLGIVDCAVVIGTKVVGSAVVFGG